MAAAALDDERAVQDAAAAGVRGMATLIAHLSAGSAGEYREIADATVSKFRKVISILNRTGHARFRRGPAVLLPPAEIDPVAAAPAPPATATKGLTLEFTKPPPSCTDGQFFTAISSTSPNSSFLSSVTADGSVSNGRQSGSAAPAMILPPAASTGAAFSSRKPPVSFSSAVAPSTGKRKCHEHSHAYSDNVVNGGRCHCSKRSRKSRTKRTIRVPAVSSKLADIPADEFSWRKYGQKPIKGSPYPRGYYKCSTLRGCPARKHVERAPDDPSMLIVTYEGEHRHTATPPATTSIPSPA